MNHQVLSYGDALTAGKSLFSIGLYDASLQR